MRLNNTQLEVISLYISAEEPKAEGMCACYLVEYKGLCPATKIYYLHLAKTLTPKDFIAFLDRLYDPLLMGEEEEEQLKSLDILFKLNAFCHHGPVLNRQYQPALILKETFSSFSSTDDTKELMAEFRYRVQLLIDELSEELRKDQPYIYPTLFTTAATETQKKANPAWQLALLCGPYEATTKLYLENYERILRQTRENSAERARQLDENEALEVHYPLKEETQLYLSVAFRSDNPAALIDKHNLLLYAARYALLDEVRCCLKAGADLNTTTMDLKNNVLMNALSYYPELPSPQDHQDFLELISLLTLIPSIDFTHRNRNKEDAMQLLTQRIDYLKAAYPLANSQSAKDGYHIKTTVFLLHKCTILITSGMQLKSKLIKKHPPLIAELVQYQLYDHLKRHITLGSDLNRPNSMGELPIEIAISNRDKVAIVLLLTARQGIDKKKENQLQGARK